MTDEELRVKVAELLNAFYARRLGKLSEINLSTICRKNPYLFRAIGVNTASDIIGEVLRAFLSSSEETVFGNIFFEPLVLAASEAKGGRISGAVGVDIEYSTPTTNTVIAVKSATNSQNASAQAKQNSEFLELRSRLQKTGKGFDAIIAYCYGRATGGTPPNRVFRRLAGQPFWEELTGDGEFYIKIIHAMRDLPDQHRISYTAALETLTARLRADFGVNFLHPDGKIHWDRLLAYNSGKDARIRLQRAVIEPTTNTIVLEELPEYEMASAVTDDAQTEDDDTE